VGWEMQEIRDRTISADTIIADGSDILNLGPALTLERCKIVLSATWRTFIVMGVQFIDCDIVAKKKLTNYRWTRAAFRDCRFSGTFSGNDFGPWPDVDFPAIVENCDFTNAVLDGCRVLGDTARSNRFPAWPCFTIFEPVSRLDALRRVTWPGEMATVIDSLEMSAKEVTSVTCYFPTLIKKFEMEEQALRRALAQAGDVFF
jgi:hypothetical protein